MANLAVDPTYLEFLASKHDDEKTGAINDLKQAEIASSGFAWDLWWTHGPVCTEGNKAMHELDILRSAVLVGLEAISAVLAAGLRAGAQAYVSTDEQGGQNLGTQLV
ncbi:type VII secretion target [Mycobacterium parmense]|uniref:Uncharacterized protein n=1 Tax=Mycobacterium parmense TaxID=185642 RepID=A0A7I7Z0V3_9MYCO|nr:type VII secretion target [Mycobacterium parmense]MCV7352755.1 hypothetical protein [Mycobacterium parmense]ORW54664.1 hypothetical protein AWC20_19420 [Mycobacterium parmense]BBZ46763.1 hypothetical protein MPRM_40440 [Mycobacterium parmense]